MTLDQEIWIEILIREQLKVELSHSLWSRYDRIQTSSVFQAGNYWMQRMEKLSAWAQIKCTKACSVPFPDARCSSRMAWEITAGLPAAPWYHSPVVIYPNLLWSLGEAKPRPPSEGPSYLSSKATSSISGGGTAPPATGHWSVLGTRNHVPSLAPQTWRFMSTTKDVKLALCFLLSEWLFWFVVAIVVFL